MIMIKEGRLGYGMRVWRGIRPVWSYGACFYLVLVLIWLPASLMGGFAAGTLIKNGGRYMPIEELRVGDSVDCYDSKQQVYEQKPVTHTEKCVRRAYLVFMLDQHEIALCPEQKLYVPAQNSWVEAQHLNRGDELMGCSGLVALDDIRWVDSSREFFDITVKDCHNFLILPDGILVHNIFPVVGVAVSFGAGLAAEWGLYVGLAGLAAVGVKFAKNRLQAKYELSFNLKNIEGGGAQAPGMPTEKDGFFPPKNWDGKKVKNPNGPGYGWKDKFGNVWVPSGPNGHGGPHWDVQYPGGGYDNVLPGGQVRGKRCLRKI